jgi:hypothetical protein
MNEITKKIITWFYGNNAAGHTIVDCLKLICSAIIFTVCLFLFSIIVGIFYQKG